MKHILYIAFLFAGFSVWSQSDAEVMSFEEVYQNLFDSTLTEAEFADRLVKFYSELDGKQLLRTSENIGETYEYYNFHYEDSLELSVGSYYLYTWQSNGVLLYQNKAIIRHQPPRQRLEAVSYEAMNPEDDKKEQVAIPVVSDSAFTMTETIINPWYGMQVTFEFQYNWDDPLVFVRRASMKEMSHGDKEILKISNVRFTAINEDE